MTARTLAAVFAHPDDETFACGAALARYAAEGVRCDVLCATDGDAGQSSDVRVGSREELGRVRRAELHDAARQLGVARVVALGLPDGALGSGDQDALVGEVVRFLRESRPLVVVTFGPEGAPNAHRDHRAISRAATAAYFLAGLPTAFAEQLDGELAPHAPRRLYYTSWEPPTAASVVRHHAVPPTARLDARPWNDAKRAAFELHRTQHVLRERFEAIAMTDHEAFALAAGEPQPVPIVDDLFAGLR